MRHARLRPGCSQSHARRHILKANSGDSEAIPVNMSVEEAYTVRKYHVMQHSVATSRVVGSSANILYQLTGTQCLLQILGVTTTTSSFDDIMAAKTKLVAANDGNQQKIMEVIIKHNVCTSPHDAS